MSPCKLGKGERRLYQVLWLVSFVTWLGAFAKWIVSAEASPWFWLACGGAVAAVVFGMAVRYDNHVWPFGMWAERKVVQDRDSPS